MNLAVLFDKLMFTKSHKEQKRKWQDKQIRRAAYNEAYELITAQLIAQRPLYSSTINTNKIRNIKV